MDKEDLIKFEEEIAELFNGANISAPVHLYYGNEDQIIDVFKKVRPQDWVFCSWRSHYQCLLKGVPTEEIKNEILAGRSISLFSLFSRLSNLLFCTCGRFITSCCWNSHSNKT